MGNDLANQVNQTLSTNSLISIVVSLICIAITWWSLQNLKLDLVIRQPKGPQGRLLHLLLAIILGHAVAGFVIDYLSWTQMLRNLF
ncbi:MULTISPECIES: DUF1146 family protein [Paenibacillus]|jgi:uncharacterized integral membrane protein (TIGR02327 family)|uniref:DUF1146 domain-containing protein n=3 Tax=Paenibacillus TaxID=44249 RepID=A0A5M9WVP1_PAEAM|nr:MULTISPECIES: DUF1146 family protein [Paenibacillus]MDP9699903.1 putative integral membrane protein (TIGR02327 family) [Paenibacillus intestini]KAA8785539.1 DUF1146 domain-containing protein [Paenibacillus amylolyticus]MBY0206747.1 DUF1146 domain-containing protein [Paenibacillus cucumis (ex Kampfer et al. 2016)]MCM3134905.1 DUF1146 family protein [Paenibacillus polysaccharolyticus]MCP1137414.1 DUF1146 family protein [Paenibacillus polysaccharolyticus]